jgi:hypothetical protein
MLSGGGRQPCDRERLTTLLQSRLLRVGRAGLLYAQATGHTGDRAAPRGHPPVRAHATGHTGERPGPTDDRAASGIASTCSGADASQLLSLSESTAGGRGVTASGIQEACAAPRRRSYWVQEEAAASRRVRHCVTARLPHMAYGIREACTALRRHSYRARHMQTVVRTHALCTHLSKLHCKVSLLCKSLTLHCKEIDPAAVGIEEATGPTAAGAGSRRGRSRASLLQAASVH